MNAVTEVPSLQKSYTIPATMKAWVLGDPGQLSLVEKPVPQPGPAADGECGRHLKAQISVREHGIAVQGAPVTETVKPLLDYRPINPLIVCPDGVDKFKQLP